MRKLYPGSQAVLQGKDFALAAGPVASAAGAGAGGSDDGSLKDDDYVDGQGGPGEDGGFHWSMAGEQDSRSWG